ncbi:MAG TPA: carbon storage regulator [Polyangiaceae bacterium]|jgi:carbon storage regulator|nr:carbon storage regulator [Polyangiaceae bacterium]
MLVISRRKGQRITIGDDIEIVVTAVHKNGVKLGIAAPRGLTVLRGEVRDAIFSANLEATKSSIAEAEALANRAPQTAIATSLPAAKLGLKRQPADAKPSQSEDGRAESPKLEGRVESPRVEGRPSASVRPPPRPEPEPLKSELP